MAMGRESEVQSELLVTWAEMPRSPGYVYAGDSAPRQWRDLS